MIKSETAAGTNGVSPLAFLAACRIGGLGGKFDRAQTYRHISKGCHCITLATRSIALPDKLYQMFGLQIAYALGATALRLNARGLSYCRRTRAAET